MANPVCPNCSKSILKETITVLAPMVPGSAIPIAEWDYVGPQEVVLRRYVFVRPEAKIFVDRMMPDEDGVMRTERRIHSVYVWDRATYQTHFKYFCSRTCAGRYGSKAFGANLIRQGRG